MAYNENSKTVFNYVLTHADEDFTARDISEATGLTVQQVNGSVTAFQKKNLLERIEAQDAEGKAVKLIKITAAGKEVDLDAE